MLDRSRDVKRAAFGIHVSAPNVSQPQSKPTTDM